MSSLYTQATALLNLTTEEYALVRPKNTLFEQEWVDYFHATSCPEFGLTTKNTLFKLLGTVDPDSISATAVSFLAHGSYGAVSTPTLDVLQKWSAKMEYNPVDFFYNQLFPYMVRSQRDAAAFVGSAPHNIQLVTNVEYGISAVLKSIPFCKGDLIIAFDFTYSAVLNALDAVAMASHASVIRIPTPDPITSESIVLALETFLKSIENDSIGKIKLGLFEHITSPTGLVLPIDLIIQICRRNNILTLIDGAHGIGQVELHLDDLGPDFYVTNPHKWLCNGRGCALLYIQPKHHKLIHPVVTSWGMNQGIHAEFLWQGTADYSPYLSLVTSIRLYIWLNPNKIMTRNRLIALEVGKILSSIWCTNTLSPDESMTSSMIAVLIPPRVGLPAKTCETDTCAFSTLHDILYTVHQIEVPVFTFKGKQYVRVSIHMYNDLQDCLRLAEAVLLAQGYADNHASFATLSMWKLKLNI
ncbi:hypothetical protein O5D80_005437 [Batrachochytrium dendrobatidis]|nr:hypothetical protein O5D80_005437 [Batrachochytrium dendrobatidis]